MIITQSQVEKIISPTKYDIQKLKLITEALNETFKKYEIIKIDSKEDLKLLSDSTTEVTEMINYLRKGNGNQSGKVTENSKTKNEEIKRTYYFNEQARLFAIIDHINTNDNKTRKLTYYFGGGQLLSVIDESNRDVTSTINKGLLYNWIRRIFSDQIIAK